MSFGSYSYTNNHTNKPKYLVGPVNKNNTTVNSNQNESTTTTTTTTKEMMNGEEHAMTASGNGNANANNVSGTVVATRKRWLILGTFSAIYLLNMFHLTQYGDLHTAIVNFYDDSLPSGGAPRADAANWLSLMHLIANLCFIVPACFLLEFQGIKSTCMVAISLTTIGSWIKCLTIRSDMYVVLLFGQMLCGIAQAFIQSAVVRLPALWFGKTEVATAISLGTIAARVGYLFGFVIPPYLILDRDNNEINKDYLFLMYLSASFFCTVTLISAIFALSNVPKDAPSIAQLSQRTRNESGLGFRVRVNQFFASIRDSFRGNRDFTLIFFSNAILVGCFYSLTTLLDQIMYEYYPSENTKVGLVHLFYILSGVLGLLAFGFIVDHQRTHKFIILFVFSAVVVSAILFWTTTQLNVWYPFFSTILLGFFMNAYQTVAYECAVEYTFPMSETISSGILNFGSIAFGIFMIFTQGFLVTNFGAFHGIFYMNAALGAGLVVTVFISKKKYKRQQVYDSVLRG